MPSYTIHMLTKKVDLTKEFDHLKEITAKNHKVISSIPADLNLLAADIAGTRSLVINSKALRPMPPTPWPRPQGFVATWLCFCLALLLLLLLLL